MPWNDAAARVTVPPSTAMNADLVLAIVLITSLATLVTCHCSLAFGLIRRHTVQRQGWLLLLPPTAWLAPYWGYRAGLRARSLVWTGSLIVYLVALLLALLDAPTSEGAAGLPRFDSNDDINPTASLAPGRKRSSARWRNWQKPATASDGRAARHVARL